VPTAFRAFLALAALAALLAPTSTSAQIRSHVRIIFRNQTAQPVWVTFYERLRKFGVQRTFIIREGDRSRTGPRQVNANRSYNFDIPRKDWIRTQAEPMGPNGRAITRVRYDRGGIGWDDPNFFSVTLRQNGSHYSLTSP
jgi:hypothetical protein